MVIDAINTDMRDQVRVRKALVKVLWNLNAEEERIAVVLLADELTVLHDFLDSAAALDDLAKTLATTAISKSSRWRDTNGSRWDQMFSGAGYAMRWRALSTLRALINIAEGTSHILGQKNLVWISSGFPIDENDYWSIVGRDYNNATFGSYACSSTTALIRDGGIYRSGYSYNRGSSWCTPTPSVTHHEVDMMVRTFNASNMNLYPIDARGLSLDPESHRRIDAMKYMAKKTGGRAYHNRNNLDDMVHAALRDSLESYVLTYSPNNFGDKSRHTIKIKSTRPGIKLRYRRSYYAGSRERRQWQDQQAAN